MFGLLWVRVIGIALLVAALFFAGWTANGWRWQSKYDSREASLQQDYSRQLQAYEKKLQDQAEEDRQSVEELQGKLASKNTTIDRLKEANKHVQFAARPSNPAVPVGACDHPFTVELPRALNRLSDAAERSDVSPGTSTPPNPGGVADAPPATSAVDGGALVDWYAEVARLYGQCKAQLDGIRKWDAGAQEFEEPPFSPEYVESVRQDALRAYKLLHPDFVLSTKRLDVLIMTQPELCQMIGYPVGTPCNAKAATVLLEVGHGRIGILPEYAQTAPFFRSVLFHEIIHSFQHAQYQPANTCENHLKYEREAYLAQAHYLSDNYGGLGVSYILQALNSLHCKEM